MTLETSYFASQIGAVIVIIATLFAILWQGYQTNKIAPASGYSADFADFIDMFVAEAEGAQYAAADEEKTA